MAHAMLLFASIENPTPHLRRPAAQEKEAVVQGKAAVPIVQEQTEVQEKAVARGSISQAHTTAYLQLWRGPDLRQDSAHSLF